MLGINYLGMSHTAAHAKLVQDTATDTLLQEKQAEGGTSYHGELVLALAGKE